MSRLICLLSLLSVGALPYSARADWPFSSSKSSAPHWGSKEYFEMRASDPPGTRQEYKFGKLWPPQPRPVGPHQTFIHRYHHSHYWPYPYNCQDREVVGAMINTQVSNGWLEQTTLYDYHFDQTTNELNGSGRAHLDWIVAHVPPEYQQVNVAISRDTARNSQRTASVQKEIGQIAGVQSGFQVVMRLADPVGRPAAEVQSIFTNAQENMPLPILSKTAGDTGSGGSSD